MTLYQMIAKRSHIMPPVNQRKRAQPDSQSSIKDMEIDVTHNNSVLAVNFEQWQAQDQSYPWTQESYSSVEGRQDTHTPFAQPIKKRIVSHEHEAFRFLHSLENDRTATDPDIIEEDPDQLMDVDAPGAIAEGLNPSLCARELSLSKDNEIQPFFGSLITRIESKTNPNNTQSLVFYYNTDLCKLFNVKGFLRHDIDYKKLNNKQFCFPLPLKQIQNNTLTTCDLEWVIPHFGNRVSGENLVDNWERYVEHKVFLKKILCETGLFIVHNPTYRQWFEQIIHQSFHLETQSDYRDINTTVERLSKIPSMLTAINGTLVYPTNHLRPFSRLSKHYTNYLRGLAKRENRVDSFLTQYHTQAKDITIQTNQSYMEKFFLEEFAKSYFKKNQPPTSEDTYKRLQYKIYVLSSIPGGFSEELAFSIYDEFVQRIKYENPASSLHDRIILADPSHGWGNRMVGAAALSFKLNQKVDYYSVDPQYKDLPLYKEKMDEMTQFVQTKASRFACHLLGECSENEDIFDPQKFDWYQGQPFDCVFTSPPYFKLETYEGKSQSTHKYPIEEVWIQQFLIKMIDNYWERIKPGGYFILNISERLGKKIQTHLQAKDQDFETRRILGLTKTPKTNTHGEPLYILRKPTP